MAVGILLVLIIAIAAGVLALFSGDDAEPTPDLAANDVAETSEPEPESKAKKPTPISNIPKSSIDQAKSVVAQVNQKASTDEILGDSSAPKPISSEEANSPETTRTSSAGITPTSSDTDDLPSVKPSINYAQQEPKVIDWIESLEGLNFGRGKLILNGETYSQGDMINPELEVRWIKADQALGILVFQDERGVIYEKDF